MAKYHVTFGRNSDDGMVLKARSKRQARRRLKKHLHKMMRKTNVVWKRRAKVNALLKRARYKRMRMRS